VVPVAPQLGLEHGLDERPEQQAVVRRHEVDRPAHHADPHGRTSLEQIRERLAAEALEPRPECRIRVVRHLGLHADEVPHRFERRQGRALEQELPGERRPVQLAVAQHLLHRAILAQAGTRPERVN